MGLGPANGVGLRIGEVAELAGVTVKAVRHYHKVGLLPEPPRGTNGYRRYGADHVLRLARIARLRSMGVAIARIADALAEPMEDAAAAGGARQVLPELRAMEAELEKQIAGGQQQLAAVARLRARLEAGADVVDEPNSPTLARLARIAAANGVAVPEGPPKNNLRGRQAETGCGHGRSGHGRASCSKAGPEQVWEQERRMWSLIDGLSWPAPFRAHRDAAVDRLGNVDNDAAQRMIRAAALMASLADAGDEDDRIEQVAAELAMLVPRVARAEADAPSSAAVVFREMATSMLSPAQRRVLELVKAAADD